MGGTFDENSKLDDGEGLGTVADGTSDENKKAETTDWLDTMTVGKASADCER